MTASKENKVRASTPTGADGRIVALEVQPHHNFTPKVFSAKAGTYRSLPTLLPESRKKRRSDLSRREQSDLLSSILTDLVPCESAYLRLLTQSLADKSHSMTLQLQRAKKAINAQVSMRLDSVARGLSLSKEEVHRRFLPKTMDGLWFVRDDVPGIKIPSDFLRRELVSLAIKT